MKKTTALFTICSLVAAAALAQEPSTPSSQQRQRQSSQSQQGQYGTQSSSRYGMSSQQSLRVSQQVIGAQVKSQDGQQLGQVEDLIVNPQSGRLEFAVISKGEKLHPIPFQLLSPEGQGSSSASTSGSTSGTSSTSPSTSTSTDTSTSTSPSSRLGQTSSQGKVTFTAKIESSKLEQAPSFSKTQWPQMSQSWSQQIYSHYGVQPEAVGSPGSSSDSLRSGSQQGSQGSSSPSSSSTSGSESSSKSSSSDPSKSSDTSKEKSKPGN